MNIQCQVHSVLYSNTTLRWLIILCVYQKLANATPSTCILEGVPKFSARSIYYLERSINDTYRGELVTFRTKNIQRVKIRENKYFNITWKDQILTLAIGSNFDKYESENGFTTEPTISVTLHFDCTQDHEKEFMIIQKVNDTNNHNPELNRNVFKYIFGMAIPRGFVLTDIIPIKAYDNDISNRNIYFEIPQNEFVRIRNKGVPRSYISKEFSTKLVTLKEIVAPFTQHFNLLVTDGDYPSREISATITIIVTTPETLNTKRSNKVFQKHLYHAQYKLNRNLIMQEKLLISNNANIILEQRGYENYFNITLRNSEVIVNNVKPLSLDIFKLDFIVIELDAFDKSSQRLRGRTAILVQLRENTRTRNEFIAFVFSANNFLFLIAFLLILIGSFTLQRKVSNILVNWFSKEKLY